MPTFDLTDDELAAVAAATFLHRPGSRRPLQNELQQARPLPPGLSHNPRRLAVASRPLGANVRSSALSLSKLSISILSTFSGASTRAACDLRRFVEWSARSTNVNVSTAWNVVWPSDKVPTIRKLY
jgi:hypothetical protein